MNEASVTQYITETFDGVHPVDAWGDTFFYYNPGRELPDTVYFATLKSKDDEGDRASNLDRASVFRLNIGITKPTYHSLFGSQPSRRDTGGDVDRRYDFSAFDKVLPHPVYGRMFWVCVLNPSAATFQAVQPLLAEAYDLAVSKYAKRAARK